MRNAVLVVLLLLGGSSTAYCQTLTGSIGGAVSGGWRGNAYVDEDLRTWYRPSGGLFGDVRPSAALAWSGSRSEARVSVSGVTGSDRVRLWSVNGRGEYRASRSWTPGVTAGAREVNIEQSRMSIWVLPYLRWYSGGAYTIDFQPGWLVQTITGSSPGDTQYRGWTGLVRATYWPTDRWRLRASGYLSDSEQVAQPAGFRGSGGRLGVRYWPSDRWSVDADGGIEQVGYRLVDGSASSDGTVATTRLIAEGGLELAWQVGRRLEIFSTVRFAALDIRQGRSELESQTRGGVRLRLSSALWQRDERTSGPGIWRRSAEGYRLEVPYSGTGQLYLTGTFNDWADPGRPLRQIDDKTHAVTLELPRGRHEYAIRIVGPREQSWLELPRSVPTVSDGFGRSNGVIYVP